MPTSTHTFSRANFDDADEARPSSDFREANNIALEPGQIFPLHGNTKLATLPLPVTGQTISLGCIEDEATATAIVFYYNSLGFHRLVRYSPTANDGVGLETLLLEWAGLNFSPELVLQGRVIGNILVYRDAFGDPRAIPLARVEAGVFTPDYLTQEPFALHLVKVPPSQPPIVTRQYAYGIDPRELLRIIQSKAYQFAYRWHYIDGEITPLGSYAPWLDILTDPSGVSFASILVTLPGVVPAGVVQVDVLVRESGTNIWQVADIIVRDSTGLLKDNISFFGQILGGALTEAETTKLYESCWPCQVLEIAGSRVFEADIIEGFPTPQPSFSAEVTTGNASTLTRDIYQVVSSGSVPGPPSQDGSAVPDVPITLTDYFALNSGSYPDPDSTYLVVLANPVGNATQYSLANQPPISYDASFTNNVAPNEYFRQINILSGTFTTPNAPDQVGVVDISTFHERSTYRVAVQFYDVFGRIFGASQPKTIYIPRRSAGDITYRSILVKLLSTDPGDLNAEIPAGAYSYSFVVARNERTTFFLQATAADVLGYLGHKIIINDTNGDIDRVEQVVDVIHVPHEKVLVDIGNLPPAGLGYVYQRGDLILFRNEDKIFPILEQRGDYLEVAWSGHPDQSIDAQGRTVAPIEIFSPNTTSSSLYYERGPRMNIVRIESAQGEQRSYSQTQLILGGDCFLVPLNFPVINRDDPDAVKGSYVPPNKKQFKAAVTPTLVESMVPPYRLAPVSVTTTTVHERQQKGVYDGFLGLVHNQTSVNVSTVTESIASNAVRANDALLWLDMSWGGRPTVIIPHELQQVRRNIIRFSNVLKTGTRLNGLGSFEPLDFYDKLPQELGFTVRMSVADQSQSDGTVLLVNQEQGVTSLYLGQQPIQADPNTQLISLTDRIIGGSNTLRGGYGCVDPATVVRYAGTVFYYSRERRELVRYNKGLVGLAMQYKYRTRLQELATVYSKSRVTGCFNPFREEYLLTFHASEDTVGITVAWSERHQAWADRVGFVPTAATGINAELLSWNGADLHRHLQTSPIATFFGSYSPPSVTFVSASAYAKTWQAIAVRSEAAWAPSILRTPSGQRSRILTSWMRFIQGAWHSAIRRDENSTGFEHDLIQALHNGKEMQSTTLAVTLTCPQAYPAPLTGASVDFIVNTGQMPNQ